MRAHGTFGLLIGLALSGCGLIGSTDDGTTDPGDEDPSPGPFDRWLAVRSITPEAGGVSTRPTLRIQFNDYIDDESFETYNTGALETGPIQWGGWADWRMTDKTLIWQSRGEVPSGLEVTFKLSKAFESVTGAPFRPTDVSRIYTTSSDRQPPPADPPPADWSDVEAIFERHCNTCHGNPDWGGLTPLTREALVGGESAQVDRPLVRPYDASDSYLMHKILWDYPDRRLTPQPPPWSGADELPKADQRTIEHWIQSGAPGPG